MSRFIVSPSGLARFFTCPKQYQLGKAYTPKSSSGVLVQGTNVHAMMDNKLDPYEGTFAERAIAYRLMGMAADYHLPIRELHEVFPISNTIAIERRVDAVGQAPDGDPVIVDWKTASYDWDSFGKYVPKAMGFQAAAYLADNPKGISKPWPARIDFIVAGVSGEFGIYSHLYHGDDQINLLQAAEIVKDASKRGLFPHNRGFLCKWCDFKSACFEVKGWKSQYNKRGEKHDKDD